MSRRVSRIKVEGKEREREKWVICPAERGKEGRGEKEEEQRRGSEEEERMTSKEKGTEAIKEGRKRD